MIARRLTVVAVTVLCACAFAVAGCDGKQSPRLQPITVDGKWGYIDETGAMVIEPRFKEAQVSGSSATSIRAGVGGSSCR